MLDLGSNAARLQLVKIRPGRDFTVLEEDRVQTRLGGGRQGRLPEAAVRKTLRAIHAFLDGVRPRDLARTLAMTTAAVRDADNAERLLGPLRRLPRLDLRVLSGREEALLGARAVVATMALDAGVVVDLGGGSLQITVIRGGEAQTAVSLPLGAVRATKRFLRHDPPTATEMRALRRETRDLVGRLIPPAADGGALVGLGGTIRTLARIHLAGRRGKREHGTRLGRDDVAAIAEKLALLSPRRRRAVPGLKADRADIIVAGALIVEELMEIGGYDRLVFCANGVRYGVLVEETFGSARVTSA